MAGNAAQLAIELSERGATDVASGMDKVGSAASSMGDKVDRAGDQADKAASKIDGTAGAADEMASKGSQAAGAMGGLGELIGGSFGKAMGTGGIALQAAADSGDLLNAALENSIVTSIRSKAATVAKTVADKASAAATKGLTLAQKALNIAQKASPIGLIITGLVLLGGLLVLAYKRSSTFRAIVDKAMSVASAAVDKVVGSFLVIPRTVTSVADKVDAFADGVVRKLEAMRDKVVGTFEVIRDKGKAAFDALLAPVQNIIDLVQNLIDKIKDIDFPDLPDLNPFRGGFELAGATSTTTVAPVTISVTVNPAPGSTSTQAADQAQGTMDAIDARLRSVGRKPVFRRT